MADPRDLVTKAAVESWINSNNPAFNTTSDNVNIPLAITACSLDWYSYTGRRVLNGFVPCNDFFDGAGGDRQFLRDFPVALVSGVWQEGIAVPAGSISQVGTITPGWVLDSKRESISIVGIRGARGYGLGIGTGSGGAYAATGGPLTRQYGGYGFGRPNDSGRQNVQVAYFAGGGIMFQESTQILSGTIALSQQTNFYLDLDQVYYALPQNGQLVQFVQVPSSPAQGQYSLTEGGWPYIFNAADNEAYISVSYAYDGTPVDIQMACIQQVLETLFTRKSVGLKSQGSPESGTTSYSKVARPDSVRMVMEKYKRAMVGD
jgi:hypothetical protein